MPTETHSQIASFIWSICNLLRGPYKRNEYRKVILPFTVLRRFDSILAPTKAAVLKEHATIKAKGDNIIRHRLSQITGVPFFNLSKFTMAKPEQGSGLNGLLDDPNHLAPNLNSYINGFSPNVRAIMERFKIGEQIAYMAEKDLLYLVIKAFTDPKIDLSPERVDAIQMGYVFEELIRIGAEQSNEEAGEHFTPREVIKLMVNLLLSPEKDLARSHVVKTIYDPACGTGGMLSVAEKYIRDLNADAQPKLFGQDWNDEAWAVCKSDMLIKGEDADAVILGDTFTKDGFDRDANGKKWTFDYMLANPPFGVEWKQQQRYIENERDTLGFSGRFGAGTPRVNDGALLFLQHMLAKVRAPQDGGSRLAIVFNGSPLFTGDAGGGESDIRRWIIENDWLEAIVALPEQLFYNTGISTYLWVLTNRKEKPRKGKVQLIDARQFWVQMEKSLGNKRRRIGDPSDLPAPSGARQAGKEKDPDHIGELTQIVGNFRDGETRTFTEEDPITHQPVQRKRVVSKIFDNEDFGYHKITVERPLRLNFQASAERLARLDDESGFKNLATSAKKDPAVREKEIEAGQQRQEQIRELLRAFGKATKEKLFKDRKVFLTELRQLDRERDVRLSAPELKAVLAALGERDETAEICRLPAPSGARQAGGLPEPDADLRDTETVPLKESIEAYFKREVLPHVPDLPAPRPSPGQFCIYVLKCSDDSFYIGQTEDFPRRLQQHEGGEVSWTGPRLPVTPIHWEIFGTREEAVKREQDLKTGFRRKWLKREYEAGRLMATSRQAGAWIDPTKTKVGYEIPLNRHFYRYEPPRPLEIIETDIKKLEGEILDLLKEVTA